MAVVGKSERLTIRQFVSANWSFAAFEIFNAVGGIC